MKAYIKIEKVIKFGNIEFQKLKFHQHEEPISIKNIDINRKVISSKVSFVKKGFKCFIGYKDAKKLDLYLYFYQKWVPSTIFLPNIEKTLMKLNICPFLIKDDELLENLKL